MEQGRIESHHHECIFLPVMRYGYTMPEAAMSPEKLTECMVGTRQALGYDGLCVGAYGGIAAMMGGHLPE